MVKLICVCFLRKAFHETEEFILCIFIWSVIHLVFFNHFLKILANKLTASIKGNLSWPREINVQLQP